MQIATLLDMTAGILVFSIPFTIGGTLNMIFCKTKLLDQLKVPIDNRVAIRGRRIFGDNKTWKGFFGMILFMSLCMGLFEMIATPYFNPSNPWLFGAALGLGYVLAELPNSFIKRQLDIAPGKTRPGALGLVFKIIDQMDSVFGCIIVIAIFQRVSFAEVAVFVLVGTLVHFAFHWLHLALRLKNYKTSPA